jgi:hypothetical protein
MSLPQQIPITCEQCRKEHPFTAWQSLNVTLDPDTKQQLITGELTRFQCPDCGWSGSVLYPMLYHDMGKNLMIWLWPAEGDPDTSSLPVMGPMVDYQFRIVSTRNQLIEKILIFDAGLDDRLVEFFKLLLQVQATQGSHPLPGDLFFGAILPGHLGAERIGFQHLNDGGSESISVPRQIYQQLADSFASKLPSLQTQAAKWLRVDRPFAQSLIPAHP